MPCLDNSRKVWLSGCLSHLVIRLFVGIQCNSDLNEAHWTMSARVWDTCPSDGEASDGICFLFAPQ